MRLPEKFEDRMKKMLGDEYDDFIKSMDETPIFTGIRINTSKVGAKDAVIKEFGELQNVSWCSDGFYADKSKISGNHPYHLAGLFYFQEPSAMSTVSALNIESDDYVLDLCAAPGGKATQAGAFISKNGLLVANEIVKNRANILSDNIDRFGLTNAVVTNETPQKLAEKYVHFFDKIIVDAPCSGEGMFRKEPQAVDEWSVEHTVSCGVRQKHILDCAMKMLKGGGYIVYSTCTFAPESMCCYLQTSQPHILQACLRLYVRLRYERFPIQLLFRGHILRNHLSEQSHLLNFRLHQDRTIRMYCHLRHKDSFLSLALLSNAPS